MQLPVLTAVYTASWRRGQARKLSRQRGPAKEVRDTCTDLMLRAACVLAPAPRVHAARKPPEERQAILDALYSRDASLNRKRLQPLIEKRPCGHAPVCTIDSFKSSSSASIELQVAGVRRWLRGPTWRQLHAVHAEAHVRGRVHVDRTDHHFRTPERRDAISNGRSGRLLQ